MNEDKYLALVRNLNEGNLFFSDLETTRSAILTLARGKAPVNETTIKSVLADINASYKSCNSPMWRKNYETLSKAVSKLGVEINRAPVEMRMYGALADQIEFMCVGVADVFRSSNRPNKYRGDLLRLLGDYAPETTDAPSINLEPSSQLMTELSPEYKTVFEEESRNSAIAAIRSLSDLVGKAKRDYISKW